MRRSYRVALTLIPLMSAVSGAAFAGGPVPVVVTEPQPQPVLVVEPGTWEGGYVGASLGYAFNGKDRVGIARSGSQVATPGTLEMSGANIGLRAGYRWQFGAIVVGPELGIEGGDIGDKLSSGGYTAETELKNAVSLRLKTGYSFGAHDTLVYGILGISRGKIDYSATGTGSVGAIEISDSYSANGYILGFGVERAITERLSLTGEYEFANYGKDTLSDDLGNSTQATPKFHNVKVGVNFRF